MLREVFLGILAGTITGLTPALHVNTLASIIGSMDSIMEGFLYVVFLYTMGLTHTFLDAFPSTFFGIPEEDTALSILPAHRLALQGRALEVVNISLKTSFLAVLFSLTFLPVYLWVAPYYTPTVGRIFVFLLAGLIIFFEKGMKKVYALIIFCMAGILGIISDKLPLKEPYFHLFVGLFGVPAILFSLKNKEKITPGESEILVSKTHFLRYSFLGTLFGMLASLLPTFTSSQAALLGSFLSKDERAFLTISFSVNTANFIFGLANFYATGKTRNGILVLIKNHYYPLNSKEFVILLIITITVGSVVNLYGLLISKKVGRLIEKINYKLLNISILSFIIAGSFYFDGLLGIGVLGVATILGTTTLILKVKRTTCMGVLMLKIMIK